MFFTFLFTMIGVYFESWTCPWPTENPTEEQKKRLEKIPENLKDFSRETIIQAENCELSKIGKPIDVVYLSFVLPNCSYKKSTGTLNPTGLQFSFNFQVVRCCIKMLHDKGIKVMLAVGGGEYNSQWGNYNPQSVGELMNDLECDGIDLDWEPHNGVHDAALLGPIIEKTYNQTKPVGKFVSLTAFSTGAFKPDGDHYKGMNIPGIKSHGDKLDWINIMAYDAGQSFDEINAFNSYEEYSKKPLQLGFLVGRHGWGDGLLTMSEVIQNVTHVQKNREEDKVDHGIFLWSYFKSGNPSVKQVIEKANEIIKPLTVVTPSKPVEVPPLPKPNIPKGNQFYCPHCNLLNAVSKA